MNKKYLNPKTGEKYHYYSPDGKGFEDVIEWAKALEPSKYKNQEDYMKTRIIKQEHTNLFNLFWVSTVWLGLDYSFHPNRNPLIFETMVFCRFPFLKGKFNGCSEIDMNRYTTRKQALYGHKRMVKKWSNPIRILGHIKDHISTYKWRKNNYE